MDKKQNLNWLYILVSIAIIICSVGIAKNRADLNNKIDNLEEDIEKNTDLSDSNLKDFRKIFNDEYDYCWNCLGWSNKSCSELVDYSGVFMPRGSTEIWCDNYCVEWGLRQKKKTGIISPSSAIKRLDDRELKELNLKKFKNFMEFENSDIEVCLSIRVFFSDFLKVFDENKTKEEIIEYVNYAKGRLHKFDELYCETSSPNKFGIPVIQIY